MAWYLGIVERVLLGETVVCWKEGGGEGGDWAIVRVFFPPGKWVCKSGFIRRN